MKQKRNAERLSARLSLRIPLSNTFYPGTVTDLSEGGMFISTEMCFPLKSRLEVLVQLKDEILKVPVMIVRTVMSGPLCKGMGVKLMNIPKKYLEYLIKRNLSTRT